MILELALALLQDSPRDQALAASLGDLPRAEVGAWEGWTAIESLPDDLKSDYGAALRAYQRQDFALTLHHLGLALEDHPDFPAALHQWGVVQFRLHRYGEVRLAMERFLEHAPEQVARTRVLGHAWYGLAEYERAREHYALVLAARPQEVGALFGDALAAWRLGLEDEALGRLNTVLERDPKHADAAYWSARLQWEIGEGEPEFWLAALARARELAPSDPRVAYLDSQILFDLGRDEEAAEAKSRFERLDPLHRELRRNQDQLLRDPDSVELWRERVQLLASLGDPVQLALARGRLEQAIERR